MARPVLNLPHAKDQTPFVGPAGRGLATGEPEVIPSVLLSSPLCTLLSSSSVTAAAGMFDEGREEPTAGWNETSLESGGTPPPGRGGG
jgi:hypothetical protein